MLSNTVACCQASGIVDTVQFLLNMLRQEKLEEGCGIKLQNKRFNY